MASDDARLQLMRGGSKKARPAKGTPRGPLRGRRGFTLVEALLVIAIMGTLGSMALPKVAQVREQARVAQAVSDVRRLDSEILAYLTANRALPPDLATIGMDKLLDPWGRPYVYAPFFTDSADLTQASLMSQVPNTARKDRFLKPLNMDFDLFSTGKDGGWDKNLGKSVSKDDVLRAYNGSFIGLASEL